MRRFMSHAVFLQAEDMNECEEIPFHFGRADIIFRGNSAGDKFVTVWKRRAGHGET